MSATKCWSLRDTVRGLAYIADSPPQRSGGFHPQAILTAKSALYHIVRLRKLVRKMKTAREFPR